MVYGFDEKKCKVEVVAKKDTYVIEVTDLTVTQSTTEKSLNRPATGDYYVKSIMYKNRNSVQEFWEPVNTYDSKIGANIEIRETALYLRTKITNSSATSIKTDVKIILEKY